MHIKDFTVTKRHNQKPTQVTGMPQRCSYPLLVYAEHSFLIIEANMKNAVEIVSYHNDKVGRNSC